MRLRDDAGRPVPRHPHGCDRGERRRHVRRHPQEQDEFAAAAQRRAATAEARAAFGEEILEYDIGGHRPHTVSTDEHPKPDTTVETLAGLRPAAFQEDGTVTAGNASGINDRGAAVVVSTETAARKSGLTPLVRLEAVTTGAMEPELMGSAPVLALKALFEKTGTNPSDIDVVKCNEAFAA